MIQAAFIIVGTTLAFTFHMNWAAILKSHRLFSWSGLLLLKLQCLLTYMFLFNYLKLCFPVNCLAWSGQVALVFTIW